MTKAILVMDMPKDCPMCPVAHYNKLDEFTGCDIVGGKRYAMTTDKDYKDTIGRPAWCPLKPMPKQKSENAKTVAEETWNAGFNACIDEITGEEE